MRWIRKDSERLKLYNEAMYDRNEWVKERVLVELGHIATSDMLGMFDDNGAVKHPKEWPAELRRAVAGIEVKELFNIEGALIGYAKKIKLWDKTKGLELTGKTLAMFVEKHEHTVDKTLEELILESYKPSIPASDEPKDVSARATTVDTEGRLLVQPSKEVPGE